MESLRDTTPGSAAQRPVVLRVGCCAGFPGALGACARHGVPESTYLLEMDGRRTFFGAHTLLIPELAEVARQFSEIDLVLLPINGLQIRARLNRQIVMDAEEAASLAGTLPAGTAVPIHYAFTGGKVADRLLLKHDGRPELFRDAATALAPQTTVRVLPPGEPLPI